MPILHPGDFCFLTLEKDRRHASLLPCVCEIKQ